MATKNLVPRADEEGKLGLSNRRWLEVNAVSGSFDNFKSNELKNLAGNQLLKAGTGITIEGPSDADEGEGAQYTISAADSGSSNAEVDRIFSGPTDAQDVTTQQQAVIANYDANDSTNNKLIFKTNETDRWYIDSNGHYVPASDVTYDLGNSVDAVRNLYVGSAKQNGQGIRLVSQSGNQLSLSIKDNRFAVSSSPSATIDGNTKYDNLLLVKSPVRVSTTENLDAAYDGLSFTLTANNPGVLLIDGISAFQVEDRVLVKDQTDKTQNGIYIVTAAGDGSTEFVLTRADDLSGDIDFSGLSVSVIEGTDNAGKIFFSSSTTTGSILGTNPLVWNDFNSTGLTAIIEDTDPHLGAHLDLNNFNLFDNQSIQLLPNSVAEGEGIELSKNNLKVNFTSATDPEFTIPTLSLASSANKEINIASVAASSFFTGAILSSLDSFTYTFDSTLLTEAEKNAGQAIFATKGWVDSQSFLTNADLPAPQDLSGYVVSGTVDTLKQLAITGIQGNVVGISMGDKNIRNLAAPVENTDAATKQYVDNTIQSVASVLDTCIVATTENLDVTLSGSTLTANTSGELPSIDGYPTANLVEADPGNNVLGSRILVKNQTIDKAHNGIYELISKGDANNPWTFERTTDFASGFQASGSFIYVEFGNTNKGNGFICTSDSNSDTVNTDDITFVKFSGAGEIQGGDGLTLTGNTLNINVKPAQIDNPENPGQLIANPDRFVYIDNEDNLDVSISNLVTALNDNGGITASAAADFTWPSTALNGDIASTDQFVILDVSENPDAKKNVTAQKIKQHVLAFDESDIAFVYDSGSQTPWTASLKSGIVTNTHLSNTAISSQPFLLNSDPTPSQVKPDDDDLILISDASDSNNLKKVKYSKFLSDLTVTPDFSSATVLPEETLELDDKVLVLDSSNGDKAHTLPFSRVARKHAVIGNNIAQATLNPGYTYTFISSNNDTTSYLFTLGGGASNFDTIEIIAVTLFSDTIADSNLGSKKFEVKISPTITRRYTWTELQENPKITFVYYNGAWRSKDVRREKLSSYTQIVLPNDNILDVYSFGNMIRQESRRFKHSEYYVYSNTDQCVLDLPTYTEIMQAGDLSHNDSIRIYFLHKDAVKRVTINSPGSIYNGLITSNYFTDHSQFLIDQKVFEFNTADMPYIELTWKKIYDHYMSNRDVEFNGWFISSPYNVEGQEAAFSLPTGATGGVLKYTNASTAVAGKVENLNISAGAVTGGVDAQGAATGSIAATSIVGGNIANDTITTDKLKTINNYKVLGSVTNDGNADNDNPNNSVTEVNVLQDITQEIDPNQKHNNLATAQAIREYLSTFSGGTQPLETVSNYEVYMTNTEESLATGEFPQTVFLGNTNSSANVEIEVKFVNRPTWASRSNWILFDNDLSTKTLNPATFLNDIYRSNYHWGTSRYNPLVKPLYHISSEIRLPGAAYWHSTFGPDTPVNLAMKINASDVGVAEEGYITSREDFDGLSGVDRQLNLTSLLLFLQIRPSGSDTNSISSWEGSSVSSNDITLKSGIPVYCCRSIGNHNNLFTQTQDGQDLASSINVNYKNFMFEECNFASVPFKFNGEAINYRAYVRKYSNVRQRFNGTTSKITVPEAYVWFIV